MKSERDKFIDLMVKQEGWRRVKKIAPKNGDQYMLRFPAGMRAKVRRLSEANGRSVNSEIIAALEGHLKRGDRLKQIEVRLEKLESQLTKEP